MVTARTRVLKLADPPAEENPFEPATFDISTGELAPGVTLKDGILKVEHDDGSATVDFNPDLSEPETEQDKNNHFANLARRMDSSKLAEVSSDLLSGIERDEQSRKEWLDTRAQGVTLLGLKLEKPRGDVGISSAPLEGMSTVRHPLLLEATVRFQATARGELLPASGPVKVRNDTPMPPKSGPQMPPPPPPAPPPNAPQAPSAGTEDEPSMSFPMASPPPQGPQQSVQPAVPEGQDIEDLASALEIDFNHYLTVTAAEYVPDTDRMLFNVGFGGDGFKKVYNCPIRQRPVSESVDAEDLIVSNAATDLKNCARITHKIKMRKSVLKRMQLAGHYRDINLEKPSLLQQNALDEKKAEVAGIRPQNNPEDMDYTIFETYCELELDEYAPEKFKKKGVPLPFRVTIEKDSREILSLIRNWDKEDKEALPKQFFVQFPFIRGIGFYGLGLIHLLGNTTSALTAAWREFLDAGMFASFPGFLHRKEAGRQNTSQIRVGPGQGYGLDIGIGQRIQDAIMPLPYKEPGPSSVAFITHVEEVGQRLGQTADVQVGEGKQDAPVGTTLALIEQATKLIDSVHKRLHAAQSEEFALLKERFREDPEAFWRHNKKPTVPWIKDQFLKALNNCRVVPVADPNNPTSLHRMAKALAIKQLQQSSPLLYDPIGVDTRVLRTIGVDPEGLFRATPAPPPPDPRMEAIKAKAQAEMAQVQQAQQEAWMKTQVAIAKIQNEAKDRTSQMAIEQIKVAMEGIKLEQEKVIHANQLQNDQLTSQQERQQSAAEFRQDVQHQQQKHVLEMTGDAARQYQGIQNEAVKNHADRLQQARDHSIRTAVAAAAHQQKLTHNQESHEQKLAHQREATTSKST